MNSKISESDLQDVLFNAFLILLSHFSIKIVIESNYFDSILPFSFI